MRTKVFVCICSILMAACSALAQDARVGGSRFLPDGEIPRDLVITLTTRSGAPTNMINTYTIRADGKVYRHSTSDLEVVTGRAFATPADEKGIKKTRLKKKLSKKQIKDLILEFEGSGFWAMPESRSVPDETGTICITSGMSRTIRIAGGALGKSVSFDMYCHRGAEDHFKQFQVLYGTILTAIEGVKVRKDSDSGT